MLREDRNEIYWWKNSHLRSHVCQTWVNIKQDETKQWKPNRIDSEKPSYVKLRKRSGIWRAPIRWWPFFSLMTFLIWGFPVGISCIEEIKILLINKGSINVQHIYIYKSSFLFYSETVQHTTLRSVNYNTFNYTTLYCTAFHYTTLHHTTLHRTSYNYNSNCNDNCTTLHITLHINHVHSLQLQLQKTTMHYTNYMTLGCTPLHCTAVRYTTLDFTTHHSTKLHYILLLYRLRRHTTPQYIPQHYIALQHTPLYLTILHYTTLHYILLPYTIQHYTARQYIPLHCATCLYNTIRFHIIPLHYTTLQCTTPHYMPQRSTTLSYIPFHYATLHSTTYTTKAKYNWYTTES